MNLTRRIDLVGYLHIGYGITLVLLACLITLAMTAGAIFIPAVAAWLANSGTSLMAALFLAAIGLPSIVAGVAVIRRASWARAFIIVLSVVDLFSFPVGTALGGYSLWILLKNRARLEFA